MESPVRIRTSFGLVFLLSVAFTISKTCYAFPSHESKESEHSQQSTTVSPATSAPQEQITSRIQSRNNTWLYQRKNGTNPRPTSIQQIINATAFRISTTTPRPTETVTNQGSKINFRGSVKYFATRPPFKPKNRKSYKSDSVEKPSASDIRISSKIRDGVVVKTLVTDSSTKVNVTEAPEIIKEITTKSPAITAAETETKTESNEGDETIQRDRSENGKSFDYEFSIDKYTSPEFHDINNVYSQPISPEIERYVIADNVSDYFVSIGSAPFSYQDRFKPPVDVDDLTTPHSHEFDDHFKKVSESIRQNLAEAELTSRKKTLAAHESPSTAPSFGDLVDLRDNATKVIIENTEELIVTDLQDSQSQNGDFNGTRIYYKMTLVSTEKYDDKDSSTTTLPPVVSNQVINMMFKPDLTRRADNFKNNGTTRSEYLSTIRMRAHTTPKPKMRIRLTDPRYGGFVGSRYSKNTTTTVKPDSTEATTRSPLHRISSVIRRRNNTLTTAPAVIDPVFQLDNSPNRTSDSDNSIMTLRKRGSVKYFEASNTSTLNLPPTATAWALISLKDTPSAKKLNNSIEIELTSDADDRENSTTDMLRLSSENPESTYKKIPPVLHSDRSTPISSASEEENSFRDNSDEQEDTTNASKMNYTKINRENKNDLSHPEPIDPEVSSKPPFESTTKLLNTFALEAETLDPLEYSPSSFTEFEEDSTAETEIDSSTSPDMTYETDVDTKGSQTTIKNASASIDEKLELKTSAEIKNYTTTSNLYSEDTTAYTTESHLKRIAHGDSDYDAVTTTTKDDLTVPRDFISVTTTKSEFTTIPKRPASPHMAPVHYGTEFPSGQRTTATLIPSTASDSNVLRLTTITSFSIDDAKDMEAASTVYYGDPPTDESTAEAQTVNPVNGFKTVQTTTLKHDSDETNRDDDGNGIDNIFTLPEQVSTEEWISQADSKESRQLDSNQVSPNNTDKHTTEASTTIKHPERSDDTSNVEIITPEVSNHLPNTEDGNYRGTTPVNLMGNEIKYETSIEGAGTIAAITISVIGVIALLLLVGLLAIMRGRRRSGGYGQRCTPVSLDSYSLDNVSVTGSTRRKARGASKRSYGNPAYDETGATSHPMQFAALANFSLDQESIINEFNEIPTITAKADEVPAGCESKNRYSNVIPLPETRVVLKSIPGDDTSDYINANYVRGPKCMKNYYIACQAPLPGTVNDFWRMIWEQNSRVILMLTELMENGSEKCYEYIPPSEVSDSRRVFGDYQIVLKKREVRDAYAISTLQMKCTSSQICREVTHMWYFWPARGVPEECHSIIAFLIEARSYLKASQSAKASETEEGEETKNDASDQDYNALKSEQSAKNGGGDTNARRKSGPLVVHCSPGTGRTGALIACDIGIRDFEINRTVDVPKTVYRIRRDRANAVQTRDQYIFVYKVLSEYATKLTGGILDSI